MTVAVVLFTSDLRLHDHPPLHAALKAADEVVPLFVLDPGIHAAG
ncbi:deoxyribodipyrimidine photo-lyase, partial [Streptomyces rochei]